MDRIGVKGSIGFGAHINTDEHKEPDPSFNPLDMVEPEDLIKYGFIPEIIGRIPIFAVATALKENELIRILTEPKNALVKQYEELFRRSGVMLEFTSKLFFF